MRLRAGDARQPEDVAPGGLGPRGESVRLVVCYACCFCRARVFFLNWNAREGQAFLGPDEADEFVTWLWDLLLSVENKTIDLSGEVAAAPLAMEEEYRREDRRSRSPQRRDERRRSRSRDRDGRGNNYNAHARSRSRSRDRNDRGGDRRRYDDRRGGRAGQGQDFRRNDGQGQDLRRNDYDDRDRGYNRGGRQGGGDFGGGGRGFPQEEHRGARAVRGYVYLSGGCSVCMSGARWRGAEAAARLRAGLHAGVVKLGAPHSPPGITETKSEGFFRIRGYSFRDSRVCK